MSTVKLFILIVIAFLIAVVVLAGPNPFEFGAAYFKPRNPGLSSVEPSISPPASETEVTIDR